MALASKSASSSRNVLFAPAHLEHVRSCLKAFLAGPPMAWPLWSSPLPDPTLRWWSMPGALLLEKQTFTGARFHLCLRGGHDQPNVRGLACVHHADAERRQVTPLVSWSGQDHEQLLEIDLGTDPAAKSLARNYCGTGVTGQAKFLNVGTQTRSLVRQETAYFVAYALCGASMAG